MPSLDAQQGDFSYEDYYIEVAQDFDRLRIDREREIAPTCEMLDAFLAPGVDILDVGCGTGRYGSHLSRLGHKVTGLDISAEQVRYARGLDATAIGSSTAMPFESEAFDACIAVMFLHQLTRDERRHTLDECCRVLRPAGVLLVKTASHEDLRRRPFGHLFPSALSLNQARYPDTPELLSIAGEAGFAIEAVQPTHTQDAFSVAGFVRSVRAKHNTTLAMLPEAEFEAGCRALERSLVDRDSIVVDHWHTLIAARKGTCRSSRS